MKVIPLIFNHEIKENEDFAELIVESQPVENGDILVIAQKVISKIEGRMISLGSIEPSLLAEGLGSQYQKDPRILELILRESIRIVRLSKGVVIVETKHGFICANAGIDESNVPEGYVTLLPENPDKSAQKIKFDIFKITGKKIAVIISDTFGRPFRLGQTNQAIGVAGICPMLDYEGTKDSFGRILRVTAIAIVDELSSAAELEMQKNRKCPATIIRGYQFNYTDAPIDSLIRQKKDDLFR